MKSMAAASERLSTVVRTREEASLARWRSIQESEEQLKAQIGDAELGEPTSRPGKLRRKAAGPSTSDASFSSSLTGSSSFTSDPLYEDGTVLEC